MGYREYPPDPALAEWVRCFWTIEEEPSGCVQDIWPDGCIELYFSSGSILRIGDDGSASAFPAFGVLGLQTGIMRVRCESAIRILSARLAPYLTLSLSPGDLANLHQSIEPLLERGDLETARVRLEHWLLEQPRMEHELTGALRSLCMAGGDISVEELAAEGHTSSRRLQRLFARHLGIAPKRVAQMIRFARGWSAMLANPNLTLAELALELGYADQAHFSKEFRRFAAQSPARFRERL